MNLLQVRNEIIKLCIMAGFIGVFVLIGNRLNAQFDIFWYVSGFMLRGIWYKINWIIDGCL